MQYTQKQLEEYLKDAYSYENRIGWEKEHLTTTFIGTVPKGKRLYDLYTDKENNYWYTVRIIDGNDIISETEYVLGHKERRNRPSAKGGSMYQYNNTGSRRRIFKSVI